MSEMDTLSATLNALKAQGYTQDFNLQSDCIVCNNKKIFPGEFIIDKTYRFEGQSNPDDSSILYAISSPQHNLKGVMVNGYGIYSDPVTDEMLKHLSV